MHPLNKKYFGASGIQVAYNNGSGTVLGYIVKQLGTTKFKVTSNGTTFFYVDLAQTTAIASALTTGHMTIPVVDPSGSLEYVKSIYSNTLVTTAEHKYSWALTAGENQVVLNKTTNVNPVTNLAHGTTTTTTIPVTWTVPVNHIGYQYLVAWYYNGAFVANHTVPTSTGNSYTITGLTTGRLYTVKVSSMTSYGSSTQAVITATTA